jgi:SAM-dependent methyltransferase
MKKDKDAFGAELLAAYDKRGRRSMEIVERDDGMIEASSWPERYFAEHSAWTSREREAIGLVKGRVLDVGCGAGRCALYLQKRGHDVTAIDNSPGAVKVCKLRGVKKARLLSIMDVHKLSAGSFDTVIMMGNNFGLFGGFKRAQRLLRDFDRVTSDQGRIIAETVDPYQTSNPLHHWYQRFNRRRGRMAGQLRLRVRHAKTIGPWFDYLLVSRKELQEIVDGTAWRIARIISDKGPGYTAVLQKRKKPARARCR